MYSTIKGAKACAKTLKTLFDESGLLYPLNRCQTAIAKAGGFRDWHDMESSLASGERPVEPGAYRRRLLAALPAACHVPVRADWDGWTDGDDDDDSDIPRHWIRDIWPYHFGTGVLHRARTPLLRPGSGAGQRLRLEIIETVLSSPFRGYPPMEPESLTFVYDSDFQSLFGDLLDHPHFPREFAKLLEARILSWVSTGPEGRGVLRVHPPEGLEEKVFDSAIGLAEYEAGGGEPRGGVYGALREALNRIGVDDATRIAKAISDQGSNAFTTPSGAALTLLTALAREGAIETFGRAVRLFSTIHPENAAFVRAQVPGKIVQYWCGARGLSQSRVARWTLDRKDWAADLVAALDDHAAFAAKVEWIARAIAEEETVRA
ncbi:hypothetical protein BH10PSE1_BH10PSE1_13880 [soil metagenome]